MIMIVYIIYFIGSENWKIEIQKFYFLKTIFYYNS
jgi:hypothetical protein